MKTCALCAAQRELVLWRDRSCRIILAGDRDHPAFCRVIWSRHVSEMTDLTSRQRQHLLTVVFTLERVLRSMMAPIKINLASLGNQVPHLHWHVIPRFTDDAHFPAPVWSPRRRRGVPHGVDVAQLADRLSAAFARTRRPHLRRA